MTGGFALVMIYDYHNGIDFKSEGLTMNVKHFEVIDKKMSTDISSILEIRTGIK